MRPFKGKRLATFPAVIGCDEAGRGALCGPVVVAAVWFDPAAVPRRLLNELDDSKRLAPATREALAGHILRLDAMRVAVAASAAVAVDRHGIRTMTLDAMRRAVLRLGIDAPVRIDGVDVPPGIPLPCEPVVRGDSSVPQIAAASIVAKTCRDRLMTRLARRYPGYCWEDNAGYGTASHLAGLARLGPTPHHRHTFRPVSQFHLRLEVPVVPFPGGPAEDEGR